jgi:HPt (histidine-containing phosphotransfer) domain-containing protein
MTLFGSALDAMPEAPVDREALLELVDRDTVFLERLIKTFRDDCEDYLQDIRVAIRRGDAETLTDEAHGLKGAAAHMQAEPARAAARRLEELGRAGELEQAPDTFRRLETAVDRLIPALEEMVENA